MKFGQIPLQQTLPRTALYNERTLCHQQRAHRFQLVCGAANFRGTRGLSPWSLGQLVGWLVFWKTLTYIRVEN